MANETVTLGYKSEIDINGTPFGVIGGSMKILWDEHEVGDSLTGRAKTHKRGRYVMQLTANFYGKSDIDYHASPLLMATDTDETVSVTVRPHGAGTNGYQAQFCLFDFGFDFDKAGELKGSVNGKSNGEITRPEDS